MAKVLIWGCAPWARSGYGVNAGNLAKRLKAAGHEVQIFAFGGLQWGRVEWEGIPVLPNDQWRSGDHGQTLLPYWDAEFQPDVILQHFDCWVLGQWEVPAQLRDKMLWYSPVDHDPCPPPLADFLRSAEGTVVAMCEWGKRMFKDAGLEPVYIPHAVDTEIFSPRTESQADVRRRCELPEEGFIAVSVAANIGERKNLPNVLRAWKVFLERHPEAKGQAYLYLHCLTRGGSLNPYGYELGQLWTQLGIHESLRVPDPLGYICVGRTEPEMADIYRACDWTILTSTGEGFGIPVIESMACGTPVIYSDFSSLPEIVGPECGLPVGWSERTSSNLASSYQWMPRTDEIVQRFEEAYVDWSKGGSMHDLMGAAGRAKVLEHYDYERIMPQWDSLIRSKVKTSEAEQVPA